MQNVDHTKYLICTVMTAKGVVENTDVVGAIFGQTEGLLGEELDLRELQKSGKIGRIDVDVKSEKGKSTGEVRIPSSLDKVETAILAAALETIDRVGPCQAEIRVKKIEDVRVSKKRHIVEKAKKLLSTMVTESKMESADLKDMVRSTVREEEAITYGPDHCPAGPNVGSSDAIIIVEGRSDVINLLQSGIRNTIAVEGTSVPLTVQKLTKERVTTALVDGDRGGELILKELLQVADIDFIANAPGGMEVEALTSKQITKALRNKMPVQQYLELHEHEKTKEAKPPEAKGDKRYKAMIEDLAGTLRGRLLGKNGAALTEVTVRDLANTLRRGGAQADAIVFDGVITQRLVDLAHGKGVHTIIGTKMGNVSRLPSDMVIKSKDEL